MRLIVLSKTHAASTPAHPEGRTATKRMRFVYFCQTIDVFFEPPLEAAVLSAAGLTLHSRCHHPQPSLSQVAGIAKVLILIARRPNNVDPASPIRRRRVVEPDGIEPTTSCLQSTRSTN